MPVFNAAAHLPEAVESVLRQSLSNIELITVDDGSSDASLSILREYAAADSRIHVIANRENKGNAHAHNEGWSRAKSNYVACMHADDIALPDRLERQVQFLDQHPRVAAVGGEAVVIDDTGRRHDSMRVPTSSLEIRAKLPWHNCLVHPTVMMRKDALADVGGYRVDLVEDYDLWLRLSEHYELANLPHPLILHRWHPRDIAYIERQVTGALAVRAAARMRASFGYDLLSGTDDLTADVLSALGVTDEDVRRALEHEWVAQATYMVELGQVDEAEQLLDAAAGTAGHRLYGTFRAGMELKRAKALLRDRRVATAALSVLRAAVHDPRYAIKRLQRNLDFRARGRPLRWATWLAHALVVLRNAFGSFLGNRHRMRR